MLKARMRRWLTGAGFDPRRLGRLRWIKKARVVRRAGAPLSAHLRYIVADPEIDNFTYDLANEDELASWLAATFGEPRIDMTRLLAEARSDAELSQRLRAATGPRWSMKTEPPLGRRLGWYAIVRALRPARMIETGIHDGLGSLVLLAALDRNAAEGAPGELVSFDVDATAGWIVGEHPRWTRRIESSLDGLADAFAAAPAQLFLHDSLHTYEHEKAELELAAAGMPEGGVLVSDNSHSTTALAEVCAAAGGRYAYWRERPLGHFYAGGGIGVGVLPGGR